MHLRLLALLGAGILAVDAAAAPPPPCGGVERWAVKVGADAAAAAIGLTTPTPATIHQLTTLPRPQLPAHSDHTTRAAGEGTAFTVDGRLVRFKLESGRDGDGDYHLVVSDDTLEFTPGGTSSTRSTHSFIAEVVNPNCVVGRHGASATPSHFAAQLAAVRTAFEAQFPSISGGWNEAGGIPVTITGIGFFDRPHGQVGRAPNGIEIHPVLDISFGFPVVFPPTSLLQNASFEDGPQHWTASTGAITDDVKEPARSGSWKAWLGGYGTSHTDTLY